MTSSSGPPTTLDLRSFKLLSFDVYCTLVDYDTGAYASALTNLRRLPGLSDSAKGPPLPSRHALLSALEAAERTLQSAHPTMPQTQVHKDAFVRVARDLLAKTGSHDRGSSAGTGTDDSNDQEATDALLDACGDAFAAEVPLAPAFADTLPALHSLSKHYRLVPLSNIDRASFGATLVAGLKGAPFAACYLAEDIGSYKPDRRNFEYLLAQVEREFGVRREEVLHVANSLHHDMRPAGEMGLKRVWVDRRGVLEGTEEGDREFGGKGDLEGVGWELRVSSMEELAELVEQAFEVEGGRGTGKRYIH